MSLDKGHFIHDDHLRMVVTDEEHDALLEEDLDHKSLGSRFDIFDDKIACLPNQTNQFKLQLVYDWNILGNV